MIPGVRNDSFSGCLGRPPGRDDGGTLLPRGQPLDPEFLSPHPTMSRYHPLYDGLWDDVALEGASFEEHGFFVFLCGNRRQRPSGIYRVTDEQLAADTTLPLERVREYLVDLANRHRIVRDGAWIFVRGYFGRQPKQGFLLKGVMADLSECNSSAVLQSFAEKYPLFSKQLTNGRATVGQRSGTPRTKTVLQT